MKIGYKISSGFIINMLLVCVLGFYISSKLGPSVKKIEIIDNEVAPMVQNTAFMLKTYQDAIYFFRGFRITRNEEDYNLFSKSIGISKGFLQQVQKHVEVSPSLKDSVAQPIQEIATIFTQYDSYTSKLHGELTDVNKESSQGSNSALVIYKEYRELVDLIENFAVAYPARAREAVNLLQRLSVVITELYLARGDFVNDMWEQKFNNLHTHTDHIEKLASQATALTKDFPTVEMRKKYMELTKDFKLYSDLIKTVARSLKEEETAFHSQRVVTESLADSILDLATQEFDRIAGEIESVAINLKNTVNIIYILTAGIVLISIISAFITTKKITCPIHRTARFAQSIAAGHLDQHLESKSTDEIGMLNVSLNTMVDSLKTKIEEATRQSSAAMHQEEEARIATARAEEALKRAERARKEGMTAAADQLTDIVHVISSASTELALQIEESKRGASEQASRVTETANAMEEMSTTVIEVARNASETSDISSQTRQKAIDGANIVKNVVESIKTVQQQSYELKEDMGILGEHAQSINQIMGVISDIADQTNLLALNAAIEAARAGEAGRGFAVVADEVRKLAEKTMISTTNVGNAIKAIQTSATKSMSQVDAAVEHIEAATNLASESGSSLDEIVLMVDATADQARAIATASEEQSSSTEEINRSISDINNIAKETTRAMSESSQAVAELAKQAQVLTGIILSMKEV